MRLDSRTRIAASAFHGVAVVAILCAAQINARATAITPSPPSRAAGDSGIAGNVSNSFEFTWTDHCTGEWRLDEQAADLDYDETDWSSHVRENFPCDTDSLRTLAAAKAPKKHPVHKKFHDPGCGHVHCNTSEIAVSRHPRGRAAWVMSMCNEPLNREALLPLSCTTHDIFLINKCGPRKHDVPSHLESCTNVLEWGWCVGGLNHCSNFNFIHDYYEQLDNWAVVYFLKGNHNGVQWGKSQVDVKELSTRFLVDDIGYEDIGTKVRPWSSSRTGPAWVPVFKKMSCAYAAKHKSWMASPRNNFMVATSRILAWPKCKYQWLLHVLHFPPKGVSTTSLKATWEFFEHVYGVLFSCKPMVTRDWQPRGGFPGFDKPHYMCMNHSISAVI